MGSVEQLGPWIRDPRSPETIATEFWAEDRAKRKRREEIAAIPSRLGRFEAILQDVWTPTALIEHQVFMDWSRPYYDAGAELEAWLAEDGRVNEVAIALGIKQDWEYPWEDE